MERGSGKATRSPVDDPLGHGDDPVFRISTRGERVGLRFRDDNDPGLRDACPPGKVIHDAMQLGGLGRSDLPRVVHGH
ncbi:MAG: hypothetical protein A2V77_24900 [Anaeromyxobacter sp. RBG_16_69_14]|nr:MAG: hypothetical protein A2V77_24900 [Anaeromyxobacter sp. RBG_16_69_14]